MNLNCTDSSGARRFRLNCGVPRTYVCDLHVLKLTMNRFCLLPYYQINCVDAKIPFCQALQRFNKIFSTLFSDRLHFKILIFHWLNSALLPDFTAQPTYPSHSLAFLFFLLVNTVISKNQIGKM